MKGKKNYFLFFFVLLFLNAHKLVAQKKNDDIKIYEKAVAAFEQKNFASSISLLETLLMVVNRAPSMMHQWHIKMPILP
jgi:hypothetical protein